MARHLLQLTLQSHRGAFRRDSRYRAATIARTVATVALTLLGLAVVALLATRAVAVAGTVAVVVGTALTIGAFIAGALSHEGDASDPRALALIGFTPVRSAWYSLALSGAGLPALGLAIVLAASLLLWRDDAIALSVGAAGALVSFATVLVATRLGILAGSISGGRRVAGDALAAAAFLATLAASPLLFLVLTAPWESGVGSVLAAVASVLAWGPFGGSWGAAALVSTEGFVSALAHLGAAVGVLAVLVALWIVLGSRLASGRLTAARAAHDVELGLVGAIGSTPELAIAARILTAWLRDPRYRVVLAVVVLVPVLSLVPLAVVGVSPAILALVPVPMLAFLFGWSLHNDLAFDSTALWLHITAAMPGRRDRLGRVIPTLAVGGALVVVGSAVTGILTGEWLWTLGMLGIAVGLLAAASGVSSVMSVVAPYPVARPGDSPFSQPVRTWGSAVWLHPLTGIATIIVLAPAIALLVVGIVTGMWWWFIGAFAVGVLIGLGVLVWGVRAGGRAYERRASELMSFAVSA